MLTQTSGVDVTAAATLACGCLKLATDGDLVRPFRWGPTPVPGRDPGFEDADDDEDEDDAVAGEMDVVGGERREGGDSVEAKGRRWDLELDLLPFGTSGSAPRLISSRSKCLSPVYLSIPKA